MLHCRMASIPLEKDCASLTVRLDRPIGQIHPHIYGTNIEHLENLVYGGLWGELLTNRKFAGHDNSRPRYRGSPRPWEFECSDPNNFGLVTPWHPVHSDNAASDSANGTVHFIHDNTTFYSGRQSLRIDLLVHDDKYHGIGQSGLEIAGNTDYAVRVVLKTEGSINSLVLRLRDLEGDNGVLELTLDSPEARFKTFTGTLHSVRSGKSDFELVARGKGQLWIGAVSAMRVSSALEGGIRSDIGTKIIEAGIKMLRWPGGNFASDYLWMDGIGPTDRRPTRLNRAWNELEPNDLGTHEFLDFCEQINVTPFICVNAGSGSVEEAAAWVEYCNGPNDSEWGRVRASNGRDKPWGVQHWSIGNEIWGNFQTGHVDPETYAHRAIDFALAMKSKDSSIHLTAVGHVRNTLGRWNEFISSILGPYVDAIAVHYYNLNPAVLREEPSASDKWDALTAGPKSTASALRDTIAVIDRYWSGQETPEISFDEWGIREDLRWASGWKERYLLRDGLNTAGTLMEIQRLSQRISMSHQFGFVNRLGLIDASPNHISETACYQGYKLIASHSHTIALETNVAASTFDTAGLATEPPQTNVPYLDAMATLSEDGSQLSISVINRHRQNDMKADVVIKGGGALTPETTMHELNGTGPHARNTYDDNTQTWLKTRRTRLDIENNTFSYEFPAHSVTLFEISLDT